MKLPRKKLLSGSNNQIEIEIEELLCNAERALNNWESYWSDFLSAPLQEEIIQRINNLHDLNWAVDGGYEGAERKKILFIPYQKEKFASTKPSLIAGIRIEGNFLFDRPSIIEIRSAIEHCGIQPNQLGDIWICNDRRAEAVCTTEIANKLNATTGRIREIVFHCEAITSSELNLPVRRSTKRFITVEASRRIDALASAGFGISRARIVKEIQGGKLRLNWIPVKQTSRELHEGDRIQLEERGSVEIISLQSTKRQRWRVELLRN